MQKITKTIIDRIEGNPPLNGYKIHWDEARGFGVRVTAEARVTYVVQGRVKGKELRFTVGTGGSCGFMTVEQARSEAKILLGKMAAGIDPREAKREQKAQSLTLRQLADEYLDRPGKLKESSKEQIERHMTTTFKDRLHRPITEITETYCPSGTRTCARGVCTARSSTGASEPGPLCHEGAAQLFHSPAQDHHREPVRRSQRRLGEARRADQLHHPVAYRGGLELVDHATRGRHYSGSVGAYDLARFYLLTGARLDEALSLRWEHVRIEDDINECFWHLPDPKNRHRLR